MLYIRSTTAAASMRRGASRRISNKAMSAPKLQPITMMRNSIWHAMAKWSNLQTKKDSFLRPLAN